MGIPPQAARMAGAWAVQTSRPAPVPAPRSARPVPRDRSHRITAGRLLHPLRGAVQLSPTDGQTPLGTQPARHA